MRQVTDEGATHHSSTSLSLPLTLFLSLSISLSHSRSLSLTLPCIHIQICSYVYMYKFMYIYVQIYVCILTHIYILMHAYVYIHMYIPFICVSMTLRGTSSCISRSLNCCIWSVRVTCTASSACNSCALSLRCVAVSQLSLTAV